MERRVDGRLGRGLGCIDRLRVAAQHAHHLVEHVAGHLAVDHLQVGVHLHLVESHLRIGARFVNLLEVLAAVGAVGAEERVGRTDGLHHHLLARYVTQRRLPLALEVVEARAYGPLLRVYRCGLKRHDDARHHVGQLVRS
eukprot:scaffold41639_cov54-Phaeocystis_antarctica.AAC.1